MGLGCVPGICHRWGRPRPASESPSFLGCDAGGGAGLPRREALTPEPAKRTKKGSGDQQGLTFGLCG